MAKEGRRKPSKSRAVFWGICLLVIGGLAAVWWLLSCLYNVSPQFNFIVVQKNESPLKLFNGEVLHLHPKDKLRILRVSTNVCFNHRVRLVSTGFDVNALLYDETSFSRLLSNGDIFNQYKFRIWIKRSNHHLGYVDLVVEPYMEDWLDKAERTIDRTKRVAILERALKLVPDNEQIRYRLIQEYKSLKRWPKAASMLEKMSKEKSDPKLLYDLLEAYEAMSKTDGIISVLRRLVMYDQSDVDIRLRLASVLEKSNKLNEASMEYESILKLVKKEDQVPIYKTLGYLYTKANQIKKAISSYLRAAELEKTDANVYYNLYSLYERIGQHDKADFFLEKAVRLKSEDIESQLVLAERLIKKGKMKEAEKYMKMVLKERPQSLKALLLMINIAESKGDKQELKETYRKILAIDPKNETIIYNLGVLEYETDNLEASLSYFEKLVKSQPKDVDVHSFLFDIYRRLKKDDLAFKEAEALVELRPNEISYYHYLFQYLNDHSDYERMIKHMNNGLRFHPENLDLREYLVLAYLKTGKEDLAARQMQEILKKRPKDITLLFQLARLQEKQGKLQEALHTYEKIISISPEHKEAKESYLGILIHLARSNEKQGKFHEALENYKKVLDISPGHQEAEEAYLRLRFKALPVER